jgi:hypothetical protein
LLRVIRPEAGEEPAGFFDLPGSSINKIAKKLLFNMKSPLNETGEERSSSTS